MKQVLQSKKGAIVVRDVPVPSCPPGSIVVRNAFSAISSGTERTRVVDSRRSLVSRARERPDLVRNVLHKVRTEGVTKTRTAIQSKLAEESPVGYSSAGTVVRVGAAVRGWAPGDRVACAGGGFANHAELVTVPFNLCARVPTEVSLEHAALTTIGAIALHGIRLAEVTIGARVGVIGCGLVGQLAIRLLRAAGAEIYAVDVDEARVADALGGGAAHAFATSDSPAERIRELAEEGLDAVLVTAASPSSDPLLLAADVARDRGALVLVGDVPIDLPRGPMYGKELSFRVSRSYGPGRYDVDYEERGLDYPIGYVRWTQRRNMECVLDLQARGLVGLGPLVSEVIPVADAARAYALLRAEGAQRPHGAILLAYPTEDESEARPEPRASERVAPRPSARTDSPRVALLGPGSFARNVLVPAFVEGGAQLQVVAGGGGVSAEAATRTLGFARFAEDEESAIDDPDVDAVVIATRHATHAALAARALGAGKHVFCEKPLALDEEGLEQVLDAAGSSDAVLLVGFNRRFSPPMREIRSFVGDAPLLLSYRVSAGTIPPDAWVHDLEQGGGRIIGEACHFLDAFVYLADAPISAVSTAGVGDGALPLQARDNVAINVTLADGSVGTIVYASAGSSAVAKERLEVFAGDRTAILDDFRAATFYEPGSARTQEWRDQDKGHRAEVRAFLDATRDGVPPLTLDEIANVTLASFAAVESLATGATVSVGRS